MAIYFNAPGEALFRNAAGDSYLLPHGSFSVSFWFKVDDPTGASYNTLFTAYDGPYESAIWFGVDSTGQLEYYAQGGANYLSGAGLLSVEADTYYGIALQYDAETFTHTVYIFTENDLTEVYSDVLELPNNFTEEYVGWDGAASPSGLAIAFLREWNEALDANELERELRSTYALRQRYLIMDCPFDDSTTNDALGTVTWTASGSPTYITPPLFQAFRSKQWRLHSIHIKLRPEEKA